jgi:hypothetical protein
VFLQVAPRRVIQQSQLSCRAAGKAVDELVSQRKQENITALTAAPLLIADNVETADLVTSGGLDFLDQWQATADAAVG